MTYLEQNAQAWGTRVRARRSHTRMVQPDDLAQPMAALDPERWIGSSLTGREVLCLASGGGLQSALCAAAGARVTVLDLSSEMLDQDREAARRFGFNIRCVQGSMEDLHAFSNAEFDLVLQPVSTCYVPDVRKVFREVARVLRPGSLYVSQHKQPVSLQASALPLPAPGGYALIEAYDRTSPLAAVPSDLPHREANAVEFIHSWTALAGGICESGFVIEGLSEPRPAADPSAAPGSFSHRSKFVPPYVKIKARRKSAEFAEQLWMPLSSRPSRMQTDGNEKEIKE